MIPLLVLTALGVAIHDGIVLAVMASALLVLAAAVMAGAIPVSAMYERHQRKQEWAAYRPQDRSGE